MNIELNEDQERLIQEAIKWYNDPYSDQVFEYEGPAGTGKSVVMHSIIERLGFNIYQTAPMAYTGAAALIMRANGFSIAKTIHSTIYQPFMNKKKNTMEFLFTGYPDRVKLVCIDEASMVSQDLKRDIEMPGIKIIACGDLNQLPPINSKPAYLNNNNKIHHLTKIMRQKENSAIVRLSNELKHGRRIRTGVYNKGEVIVIERNDFDKNIKEIAKNYSIILCAYNKTRDKLNKIIREDIYKYESPYPYKNERLICRKNNWNIMIEGIPLVNGLIGRATNTVDIDSFKSGAFNLNFKPDMMNDEFTNLKCDNEYFLGDQETKNKMRDFNSFNYSDKEYFEYAYAITTHVSQGSQFSTGVYIQEYLPNITTNLNYTGITRFRDKCLYVIPNKKYY